MPQQRQVGRGEALVVPTDLLRLAQLLAAPQPHLEAQRCGHLVISPQLRQQRLRRRPQLIADAAEVQARARCTDGRRRCAAPPSFGFLRARVRCRVRVGGLGCGEG
eukprot:scaffold5205_cov69-Phaeocystis_antarctica.AAC.2